MNPNSNETSKQEEVLTPQFVNNDNNAFFEESIMKGDNATNKIFERNNTKYSDKKEPEVGTNMNVGQDSIFRKDMDKQITQETGVGMNSQGGSTIRFGGSFKKKSVTTKENNKGNFEDNLYSEIRIKDNKSGKTKPNIMEGSNVKIQAVDSDEDDPMSFLDDLVNPSGIGGLGTMSEHRKNPEIHRDAQHMRHYYEDSPLTVVSEEQSTRHTVLLGNNLSKKFSQFGMFPFESDISSSPSPISGHGTVFKNNNKNFNYSQQSGGHSSISGKSNPNMVSSEIVFRMNRTKSAYLQPNIKLAEKMEKKNRRQTALAKSMKEMDDIKEQSKHEISHESGNLIPQSPIMRVHSEGTKPIPKRTFLPDDEGNKEPSKNMFFGKFKPMKPLIMEHETNSIEGSEFTNKYLNSSAGYKELKLWTKLPIEPIGPDYEISFLSTIKNKKAIQKKKGFVENTIFKLTEKGLYYDGSLSFGKLSGNGMLLLNMICTSDMNSPEVKENLLYHGHFKQNKVEGKGTIFFQNNAKFEGSFTNGIAHGNGKLIKSDGEIISGIWLEGKLNI